MSNYARQKKDKEQSARENKNTEQRIRLQRYIPKLELKLHKNGNKDEIEFIYNLENNSYKKYREKIYRIWNEENQKRVFNRFMKKYSKNIEIIYIGNEAIRILQWKKC